MSLVPVASLIARRFLRRTATLSEISTRTWTLSPSELTATPPAIFLPEMLDRVAGVVGQRTIKGELERVNGGMVEHGATVAHAIENVHLIRGSLYAGAWKSPLLPHSMRSAAEVWTRATGALSCSLYGNTFFGHWLIDDLSLSLAAESLDSPVIVSRPPYHHEGGYRELLSLTRPKCSRATFDRLLVLEDIGQNSFKRQRYEVLRARVRRLGPGSGGMVYIRRGSRGAQQQRLLVNAPEVERFLVSLGARVIDPDELSPEGIARELLDAQVVFGTEGSHLAHAIYPMARDGTLFVLQSPAHFNNVFKDYTDCLGTRYAFVVGRAAQDGFTIDTGDIGRTLEHVQKRSRAA